MNNEIRKKMLNTQAPYVGKGNAPQQSRGQQILDNIDPRMLQVISDWEAVEERHARGWGPGGKPKVKPRVPESAVLKAEAILKAQERLRETQYTDQTGDVSKLS